MLIETCAQLATMVHATYRDNLTKGSDAWRAHQAAKRELDEFDLAHPSVEGGGDFECVRTDEKIIFASRGNFRLTCESVERRSGEWKVRDLPLTERPPWNEHQNCSLSHPRTLSTMRGVPSQGCVI